MKYYRWAVGRALQGLAVHAIVEKRFKNRRLTDVDRTLESGHREQLQEALLESEDSTTVNTSFVSGSTCRFASPVPTSVGAGPPTREVCCGWPSASSS